ncbi:MULTISPECIES: hypothetical protein [Bacillati]|jgi:hypothetical protein|uniref:Uncharacterized protein n=1 Tax=Streptococcus agalactiae TaxID=1311 RepID=A0AAW6XZ26_STRAG|nr:MULTISPECIES: hypothetical protein [Terrabacteria group]PLB81470.1 hypothetical protein CYJ21_04720 [Actinomyces sp. UMB0138]PMC93112.1 hypothetical protein CJ188_04800 [Actinomyces sp. UMB0918]DAZ21575.1 MAG TPA: hypothetical protein [Caudoviricetes sp.]MBS5947752.1 hypothetical protein [Winkia neuii]MDK6471442.1 hypothetical protein [Streptococcus agalactiae]
MREVEEIEAAKMAIDLLTDGMHRIAGGSPYSMSCQQISFSNALASARDILRIGVATYRMDIQGYETD